MRILGSFVVLVALAPVATAEVWQDRVIPCEPGASSLTSSSHILYVNDCLPDGCTVRSGSDSSITDSSTISPQGSTRTMEPYQHGTAHWDAVMQCVVETFAPFDIQVVTEDPGPSVPHYEVMAAGTSANLNPNISGAGGIAPFIACNANRNNALAFVFANQTGNVDYLCGAIVHEAGHVYGLSHSLHPLDPMTYMDLGSRKVWQNAEQTCGTDQPQNCRCFDDTQNSFRYLNQTFGLSAELAPASLTITTPKNNAYVLPGFPISATFVTPLETLDAGLTIDGANPQPPANGILAWNAPTTIAPGPHTIAVNATDFGDRSVMTTSQITVLATCAAGASCGAGFACLGGTCLPDANVAGGLGATCTSGAECITGTCATAGDTSLCTGTCDAGNVCPSGFSCETSSNVCWPDDSGGCNAGGGSSFGLLAFLGLLGLRRRRR